MPPMCWWERMEKKRGGASNPAPGFPLISGSLVLKQKLLWYSQAARFMAHWRPVAVDRIRTLAHRLKRLADLLNRRAGPGQAQCPAAPGRRTDESQIAVVPSDGRIDPLADNVRPVAPRFDGRPPMVLSGPAIASSQGECRAVLAALYPLLYRSTVRSGCHTRPAGPCRSTRRKGCSDRARWSSQGGAPARAGHRWSSHTRSRALHSTRRRRLEPRPIPAPGLSGGRCSLSVVACSPPVAATQQPPRHPVRGSGGSRREPKHAPPVFQRFLRRATIFQPTPRYPGRPPP